MPSAAKPSSEKSGLRRARGMAAAVLEHHFGKPARRLSHRAAGLSNYVFQAEHPAGQFVVRIAEKPDKLNAYIKEQWAIRRVRELGVPTAEVLEVGSDVIGMPYMIARCVRGEEAIHHPQRLDVLRDMGRYTALINSVPTTGFGRTFEWSANRLSHNASWSAYLESELALEHRLEILQKTRMLAPAVLRRLRGLLLALGRKRKSPTLN